MQASAGDHTTIVTPNQGVGPPIGCMRRVRQLRRPGPGKPQHDAVTANGRIRGGTD